MIRVGLVGAGMVAEVHARALKDLEDFVQIAGVHARTKERLDEFCKRHNLEAASSLDSLLDRDIDVLIVLTPPNARKEIVQRAAEASKHVLLEKPLERNSGNARELVQICEKAGVTLGVVFQHRFRESSQKLLSLLAENQFGQLACARALVPWWRPQSYYDEPGRGTYERDGGGVLINQAIHTLDLLQLFAGPVAAVQSMAETSRLHHMEAEDFVAGGVWFASGAIGSIVATTASFPGEPESIDLDFERASVRLKAGVLDIAHHDGRKEQYGEPAGTGGGADPMAFPHHWHTAALRDFLEAVRDGREPMVSGREGLKVHRLIDALVLSAKQGKRVEIDV